mgnify:CR=1|jgi:hypothetical protein
MISTSLQMANSQAGIAESNGASKNRSYTILSTIFSKFQHIGEYTL